MLEFIRSIPGPVFLWVYMLIAIGVIFFAKYYAENDYSKDLDLPEPTTLKPLDIAILMEGLNRALLVSVFNLWRKRKIEIQRRNEVLFLEGLTDDLDDIDNLEKVILKNIQKRKPYDYFFFAKSTEILDKILKPNIECLERLDLIATDEIKRRYWISSILTGLFLFVFGITKVVMGINNDRPVGFLVMLMLVSIIAVFIIIKPYDVKTTALGRRFLNSAKGRFEWLKKDKSDALMADDNLLYGIALFGVSAMVTSSIGPLLDYPILVQNYTITNSATSFFGGNSGGCSSGGCGGGGGCGGCGGCGS